MERLSKTRRKRVTNFSAYEKALLVNLIKKNPILQSKGTDGKTVAKKQEAWDRITQEFNKNANVHKRATINLKRAYDNIKSFLRKARSRQKVDSMRPECELNTPPPPQEGDLSNMVEEPVPAMFCEITNTYDSDTTNLNAYPKLEVMDSDTYDMLHTEQKVSQEDQKDTDRQHLDSSTFGTDPSPMVMSDHPIRKQTNEPGRRPMDYVRREAVMRIRHLENRKKMEMQILKTQLEIEEIKKRSALFEEERHRILLEKAKIELDNAKALN